MKYEKFKLELCAEYGEHDGATICVILHPETHIDSVKYLHDVQEDQTCLRIFWVIYGITPEGIGEALIDGDDEADMKAKFDFLQGLIEVKDEFSGIRDMCIKFLDSLPETRFVTELENRTTIRRYLHATMTLVEEKLA